MNYWKLGCRWDSHQPLFFEFIKKNEIVVGWLNHPYAVGDWLLLTDGFEVLGFAQIIKKREQVINFPELQVDFKTYKIPFTKDLFVSKAKFIELKKEDRFIYKLQPGIRKIGKKEIIETFKALLPKYLTSQNIKKMEEILSYKKQIILQGPPGTGKTYTAKDIAYKMIFDEELSHQKNERKEQLKRLEQSEQFKLVQFHPSYTYEDFVRGITAKSNGTQIEYLAENKILAKFAEDALKNQLNRNKAPEAISKEKWLDEQFELFIDDISEEIDENEKVKLTKSVNIIKLDEDSFRYKGVVGWSENGNRMLFSDIKQAFLDENTVRQDIKKNQNLSGLARHHASYYIRVLDLFRKYLKDNNIVFTANEEVKEALKNYILIIDEINRANLPSVLGELIYALEYRGSEVSSMYEVNGKKTIIIPENLFIIGTMNTADRSVSHIDYAIRRRFAFVNILPNNSVIENIAAKTLFEEISNLFESKDTLASDFKKEHVQLGHSYFIVKDEEELNMRAKYEIIPILEEYLKDGILLEKAEKIILDLKKRFES